MFVQIFQMMSINNQLLDTLGMYIDAYHIVGMFGGGKFGKMTLFKQLAKESLAN